MTDHYSGNDPATGCAIGILAAAAVLILALGIGIVSDWRLALGLLLACTAGALGLMLLDGEEEQP